MLYRHHTAESNNLPFYRHLPCRKELRIKPISLRVQTRRSRPDQTRPGQTRPGQVRPNLTRTGQAMTDQARSGQTRPDHEILTVYNFDNGFNCRLRYVTVRHNRDAFCAILCQSEEQPNNKSVRF